MHRVSAGSLFKRGEVWYWSGYIDGKRVKKRIGHEKTTNKHEAERAVAEILRQEERSFYGGLRKITLEALAQEWLKNNQADRKPHTLENYNLRLGHIVSHLGDFTVSAIQPDDVERFKREAREKWSATTVSDDLNMLRRILDCGIKWGYLYQNPAKLVASPHKGRKALKPLTREEVRRLIDAAEGQGCPLLMVAAMTGMRMGEILAMKWESLDSKSGTYRVSESYSKFGLDTPKTESSFRTVELSSSLLQALREHKIRQNEHRLRMGGSYQDHGLIFATEVGTHINPSNLRNRIFYPALKKAGLPGPIRFHDLRGCYATLALEAGANPKSVQDQLGHKTARITLEIYARVNSEAKKRDAGKLEEYVFGR